MPDGSVEIKRFDKQARFYMLAPSGFKLIFFA